MHLHAYQLVHTHKHSLMQALSIHESRKCLLVCYWFCNLSGHRVLIHAGTWLLTGEMLILRLLVPVLLLCRCAWGPVLSGCNMILACVVHSIKCLQEHVHAVCTLHTYVSICIYTCDCAWIYMHINVCTHIDTASTKPCASTRAVSACLCSRVFERG